MKKIKLSLIIIICFFIIFGTSCKNNEEIQTTAQTMEYAVAYELSNIEDVDSLDEETAKALSIVIRTRLINNPEESPQNIDKSNIDEKYLNIVNKTSNQILNYNNNIAEVSYAYTEEEEWSSEIKKSEILSYMMKNKISLSNISDIEKLENDSGELEFLVIGGKSIPFSSNRHESHFFYVSLWRKAYVCYRMPHESTYFQA